MKKLALAAICCSFGCATIVHGSSQDISVSSTPSGADVVVDDVASGKTPVVLALKREKEHKLRVNVPGYLPYEVILTKSVSGWVAGNLLLGGVIGLLIDATTGAVFYLSPEQVEAQLAQDPSSAQKVADGDAVYLRVTLKPDPGWKRIAQLDPAR